MTSSVVARVNESIGGLWDSTIREAPRDEGTLIALPHPYTVPCPQGRFQEMYYWDTYYTNEGLITHGRLDLAWQNTQNLLALVERFGFAPNGNRTFYLNRSQPPHLLLMVESLYTATGDDAWLKGVLPTLEREYAFWMTRRLGPNGLNHYGHDATEAELRQLFTHLSVRWQDWPPELQRPAESETGELLAECESGWDFTPRFAGHCATSEAVDLNALLYHYEVTLARWLERFSFDGAVYHEAAVKRLKAMRERLWSQEAGAFLDRNFVTDALSPVLSAATFYPLWLGVATPNQAQAIATRALARLSAAHGLLTCAPGERKRRYQWDAPNLWPPLAYAAVRGLERAGYLKKATTVAQTYLGIVSANFESSGRLWEKYNAETGFLDVTDEYAMPVMLGWTAGVFAWLVARYSPSS